MDMWDAGAVRARLRERAARGRPCELDAPLSEGEIRGFEERHGIRLPAEYRAFVAGVGDGPAGPGYGLMPLVRLRPEADEDGAAEAEWQDDRRPGRLSAPCPISGPRPFDVSRRFDEREGLTLGTLMLADRGCGTYARLILNGPLAGQVWSVDQDFGACHPESPDFCAWYTDWLGK